MISCKLDTEVATRSCNGRDASTNFNFSITPPLHIVHSSEDVYINLRHCPDLIYYYIYMVEVWSNSPRALFVSKRQFGTVVRGGVRFFGRVSTVMHRAVITRPVFIGSLIPLTIFFLLRKESDLLEG